ncbi:MAG: hypothetical protein K5894_15160 [Lachnospiraceae bacterium]|nr:hypothetical protein [Lachnospiraceae bacterium]
MQNENKSGQSHGKVIWDIILSNYPGAVLYGLLFNISLMIDSIIAGQSLGANGIAAVALGVPGYGILAAIVYSLIHGSGLRMIWAKGRADEKEFRRALNGGTTLVGFVGFIFAVIIFIFADTIVILCGGDMVEDFTRNNAVNYLCFCAPIVFLTALGMILQELMNVLGLQTYRAALGAVNIAVNLIVSITCVIFLPVNMKLAGLGIGTSVGGLVEFIVGIIILRVLNVRLNYRPVLLRPREIAETIRCGFPAAADYFAENVVMGIQNNLILSAFSGESLMLATSEIVCNISYFASGSIKGAAIATEPMFGVFYEERDVNSIKKVWKKGWMLGMLMSVVWGIFFYLSVPVISNLFGMEVNADIYRGMLFSIVFYPFMHTVYMFTLYYEATKRFSVSMAFAIVPDSILYIIMMAILIPILGKDGIWLSITGNQLLGLILLIPLVLLIASWHGIEKDRLLLLPEEFYSGKVLMETEVSADGRDEEAKRENFKDKMQELLTDQTEIDNVMFFMEEIMSVVRQNSNKIHISLKDNNQNIVVYIRNSGKQYDPLSSISEEIKSAADEGAISYSYVYKMNILTINLREIKNIVPEA